MTHVPTFLASLPEAMRTALVAQAAADHATNPGPPLSPATKEALRTLLWRPAPRKRRPAA
jgi:hypothetical protein